MSSSRGQDDSFQSSPRRRGRTLRSNRLRSNNDRPRLTSLFGGGENRTPSSFGESSNDSNGRSSTNGTEQGRTRARDALSEESISNNQTFQSSQQSAFSPKTLDDSDSSLSYARYKTPPNVQEDAYDNYMQPTLRGMMSPSRESYTGNDLSSDYLTDSPRNLKPPPKSAPAITNSSSGNYDDLVSIKMAAMGNQSRPAAPETYIEIAPGVTARLRGAKETWACIENDFYLPTTCLCCEENLFCIMDADFVLCPHCKVVSPMAEATENLDGGVGLGFSYQDLQKWQTEIMSQWDQQQTLGD